MPRVRTLLALSILAPAATVAAQANASHASHAPTGAGVVQVVLQDYAFEMPATIPAGVTTLRAINKGKEPHHAIVVRLDAGKSLSDLLAAMKNPGPPPAWAHILGGPQAGADVALDLSPGNYALLCLIPSADGAPHVAKGMSKAFTVVPSATKTAAPKADVEVTMQDYGWTFSRPLKAGRQTLKLVTAPGQPHELVALRMLPGKTPADLAAWEKNPSGAPPFDWMSGISPAQAGIPNYWTVDLKPGKYVLVCFIPDAKDGKPHLEHGMMKEIEIN